jgi:hypothetical protein
LIRDWKVLTENYPGWTLNEIKDLSPRERINWLELAREDGKVKKIDG